MTPEIDPGPVFQAESMDLSDVVAALRAVGDDAGADAVLHNPSPKE